MVQVEELVPGAEEGGRKVGQLERDLQTSREKMETLRQEKEDGEQNVSLFLSLCLHTHTHYMYVHKHAYKRAHYIHVYYTVVTCTCSFSLEASETEILCKKFMHANIHVSIRILFQRKFLSLQNNFAHLTCIFTLHYIIVYALCSLRVGLLSCRLELQQLCRGRERPSSRLPTPSCSWTLSETPRQHCR